MGGNVIASRQSGLRSDRGDPPEALVPEDLNAHLVERGSSTLSDLPSVVCSAPVHPALPLLAVSV